MAKPAAPDRRAPRADARRNIAAILAAGERCLTRDPDATVSLIATEAGVGRVTLYGHFPSRAHLVEAVFARVVAEAHATLDGVDISGDPVDALDRLLRASWQVVHRFRCILAAAERELSPTVVRGHHDLHLVRLTELLERGCAAGRFRVDVPVEWLATVCFTLMHAAAAELATGRIGVAEAEHALLSTVRAACEERRSSSG